VAGAPGGRRVGARRRTLKLAKTIGMQPARRMSSPTPGGPGLMRVLEVSPGPASRASTASRGSGSAIRAELRTKECCSAR